VSIDEKQRGGVRRYNGGDKKLKGGNLHTLES
jgi:hypothetical protein